MRIMVTCGSGFIGSAVVLHTVNDNEDHVVNIYSLAYASNLESLLSVSGSDRFSFEQVDNCDRAALDRIFSEHQPDLVMHLAAKSHFDHPLMAQLPLYQPTRRLSGNI